MRPLPVTCALLLLLPAALPAQERQTPEPASQERPAADPASQGQAAEEAAPRERPAAQDAAREAGTAEPVAAQSADGPRTMSGMSILGNEEAPKALVIVPWKSSELGDELGMSDNLDDRAKPVDKEVFLRELRFYRIRKGDESPR